MPALPAQPSDPMTDPETTANELRALVAEWREEAAQLNELADELASEMEEVETADCRGRVAAFLCAAAELERVIASHCPEYPPYPCQPEPPSGSPAETAG